MISIYLLHSSVLKQVLTHKLSLKLTDISLTLLLLLKLTFKVKALAVNDLYSNADDWIEYKPTPAAIANYYSGNTLPYANSVSFDLPIHRRNTYFSCRIFDNSPFPCTLSRMMWEGYYNPRFYRRN